MWTSTNFPAAFSLTCGSLFINSYDLVLKTIIVLFLKEMVLIWQKIQQLAPFRKKELFNCSM